MNKIRYLTIVLGVVFSILSSCGNNYKNEFTEDEIILTNSYDTLEALYYGYLDTLIRYPNEVIIICSKLDTIIKEEGIFTFLKYDFEIMTPEELVIKLRVAVKKENEIGLESANSFYKDVIQEYDDLVSLEYRGDTNGYLEYMINASIICSYAYEKIGDIDKSIKMLIPYMANSEVYGSKIQERYIKLCIQKYGIESVRNELNRCGRTIEYVERPLSYDNWTVQVFGGKIGMGSGVNNDSITIDEATRRVKRMKIYSLVN